MLVIYFSIFLSLGEILAHWWEKKKKKRYRCIPCLLIWDVAQVKVLQLMNASSDSHLFKKSFSSSRTSLLWGGSVCGLDPAFLESREAGAWGQTLSLPAVCVLSHSGLLWAHCTHACGSKTELLVWSPCTNCFFTMNVMLRGRAFPSFPCPHFLKSFFPSLNYSHP